MKNNALNDSYAPEIRPAAEAVFLHRTEAWLSRAAMSGSWTEAQQAFLQQAAKGEAEAVRRMQQFGDDYLGITRELWKYVESRGNPAPGAAPPAADAGLERLRDSLQQKFARLFAPSFDPLRAQQLATGRLTAATIALAARDDAYQRTALRRRDGCGR